MCWANRKLKFKIAENDIRVYKTLKDDHTSIFFGFEYIPGIVYKESELGISYSKREPSAPGFFIVNKAFHSFKSLEIANILDPDFKAYSFIIPKGAIYAINYFGQIVSNQIMLEP